MTGRTRWRAVEVPVLLEPPPAGLGRLDPLLRRLAAAQGAWPPRRPEVVRPAPGANGLATGQQAADAAVDDGVDLLVADTALADGPALTAVAAMLDLEPVAVVGTSGGAGWAVTLAEVRDGLRGARGHLGDPEGLLVALEDPQLAGLAGVLAQAAVRRTPVLLGSGAGCAAAALLAERLAPGASSWFVAGCSPAAPGARRALEDLGLEPLLDLRLPGPGGAELALGVLLGGVDLLGG